MKQSNTIDGIGPIEGMEGPFKFKSGAVLHWDPIEGKFYARCTDIYLENKEAERLTK